MSGTGENGVEEEGAPPYLVPHSREPIRILHEDPDLLVVRKPHLLLSVPGRHPANRDCLLLRLQADYPEARIVHRLDLDTSGVMLIPLSRAAQAGLARQFQARAIRKEYHAVVDGEPADDHGEINLPLAADWPRRPLQKVDHERGREAITRYRVLERHRDRSRLLLQPVTGRSHQLRLHLAAVGHPILGCDFYAPPPVLARAHRLLLHASAIACQHPISGRPLQVSCAPDF